ncbi:GntR family transcriptional regulator [Phenylobacterium sp.]|uniref:GntR family transcriptional regulator n=1 Tax=Phenylobacterium sp. TaxID=1871053 RepID=UPI002FC9E2E9
MNPIPDAPDMRSKSASAYEHLKRLAIRGDLRPGRRLSSTDLASHFQISITPVRDALVRLEVEGFIRLEANRGYFTKPWTVDEQRDLLRIVAMHLVASLEARGGAAAQEALVGLDQALSGEGADPAQAAGMFVERQEQLHTALVASTGNVVAGRIVRNALDRTYLIRRIDLEDPAARAATAAALHGVVEAMSRADLIGAIEQSRADINRLAPRLPQAVARANEEGQKLRFP